MQHKFSRHIKLLICVTLYNEDQETLGKTLLGICEVGRAPCQAAAGLLGTALRRWRRVLARPVHLQPHASRACCLPVP